MVTYATFEKDLGRIFADELRDYKKSQELYAALCNTHWEKDDVSISYTWRSAGGVIASLRNDLGLEVMDPDICQNCGKARGEHLEVKGKSKPFFADKELEFVTIFCDENKDARFYPGYSGSEDYLDFYCSGGEGDVSDWIEERLAAAGYKKS